MTNHSKIIDNIVNAITSVNSTLYQNGIGLMSGLSGIGLLLYEKGLAQKADSVNQSITELISNCSHYSFCNGLAGIGWFYQFMNDEGYFEDDTNELLEDFDIYLSAVLKALMLQNETDFLHGATGIAYYFYCRSKDNPKVNETLQMYMDDLSTFVETDGDKTKLATKDFKTKETIYNISLSHGISAVVSVLAHIYTIKNLHTTKLKKLIEGFVNYILAQEIDHNKYGSYFPYTSIESSKEMYGSRLAWCYGDLGICMALYQAGKALNRHDWIDKAINILLYTAEKRRNLTQNSVVDACICHGTTGIGQIFYRMWWNTRLPEFKAAADYWFDETLKMAKFEDGLAGYKFWMGTNKAYEPIYGLLEGIAGIGLALLSYISEKDLKWDECLLLS